jgi:hypothetical protein
MAIAMLMPSGVFKFIALATVSPSAAVGRLSAGNVDRMPAIPDVIFYDLQHTAVPEREALPDA